MVLPFVWMILTSLKTIPESVAMNPFKFFPKEPMWSNYSTVLKQHNFSRLYLNTGLMILIRIVTALMFSSMAAYAFARLKFPGRDFLFGLVLIQMMVPGQIFVIPQYIMVDKLGMRNSIFALAFPGLVSAFGTFLLRQFFMSIPDELEEAAVLDGCNTFQIYWHVMFPLVKSGLIALGIFTALFAFKDMMWPMIINSSADYATLSSALAKIQSAHAVNYPQLMAAAVLAIWPIMVLYTMFQKQFMQGISTTGGKL